MFSISGTVLSTSRTFIFGCFLEKYREQFPELYHLINTRRFNDPDVIKSVFMAQNDVGEWYFKSDIMSSHVAGIIMEFVNVKNITFDLLHSVLLPFLRTKISFDKMMKVLNCLITSLRAFKMVKKNGGAVAHEHNGKFVLLFYKMGPNDHIASVGIIRIKMVHGEWVLKFMHLDDKPTDRCSELFNADVHTFDRWEIIGNDLLSHGIIVGRVLKYLPVNIKSEGWKTAPAITKIHDLLYNEYRNKYLNDDYSTIYDECLAEINKILVARDARMADSGTVESQYEERAFTILMPDLMEMLKIPSNLGDIVSRRHFNMADFAKTNSDGSRTYTPESFSTRHIMAGIDLPDHVRLVDGDECDMGMIRKIIAGECAEDTECGICGEPTIPGIDKVWTSACCGGEKSVCRTCHSAQRREFFDCVTRGAAINTTQFNCHSCGELSPEQFAMVTNRPCKLAKLIDAIKDGKRIFACKNQCRNFVCEDDIGCAQAGAEGVFACEKCNSETDIVIIKCPHCEKYLTHDGASCNLMKCCMGGYHAHDYVSASECEQCGHGTEFCGGSFRLSQEVQDLPEITCTGSYTWEETVVGMEGIFRMTKSGAIIPYVVG
jgi:hypothetical protein